MRRSGVADERGTALLVAVTLVLLLAAVGAAVSIASRTETLIAGNFRQSRDMLYAAEGGIARAIRDLDGVADWSTVLSGAAASSFTDGAAIGVRTLPWGDTISLCCDAASLTGDVQRRAHGGRSWGADTPRWQIFAWGRVSRWLPGRVDSPTYVVVWVADDPVDGDGNPAADANGVVGLYAQALGYGGARGVADVVVERRPGGPQGPPLAGVRILSWREGQW